MYDVSIVTDALRDIVLDALASSPLFGGSGPSFSVAVSGQHPEQPTGDVDCDLNLYLFHLSEDRHQRNSFWSQAAISGQPPGPPRQPVAFEPLCLDLWFVLSAYSQTSYVHEQQVMSVAVRALHERAIVRLATPTPTGQATSEITLAMESPSSDELSRLWQAFNAPLRMTAEYKASVVMLTPESGLTAQPEPTTWTLLATPADEFDGGLPLLFGTSRRVAFVAPAGPRTFDQTPASTAPAPAGVPGQELVLRGRGLRDDDEVFLVTPLPDGTETEDDITSWRVPLATPPATVPADGLPIVLRPPDTPGACPPPGRYLLRVGRSSEPGWRSQPVPLSIAPWIDPAGGPLLSPDGGGIYTCAARNVPDEGAELRLGTMALQRRTSGTPTAGQWRLSGTTLTFAAPAGAAPGQYAIRLRCADVEADAGLWAVIA